VMFELATGNPPWSELAPMAALFKLGTDAMPDIPSFLSREARRFLGLCFTRDPKQRPTAKELLAHPFLANAEPLQLSLSGGPSQQLSFQEVPAEPPGRQPSQHMVVRGQKDSEAIETSSLGSHISLSIDLGTDVGSYLLTNKKEG